FFVFTHIKFSFRGAVRHHVDRVCSGAIIRCRSAFFRCGRPPAESRGTGGNGGRSRSQYSTGHHPPCPHGGRRPQNSKEQDGLTGYDRAVCSSPRSPPPLFGDGRPKIRGLPPLRPQIHTDCTAPSHSLLPIGFGVLVSSSLWNENAGE